jgi:serine/threonine protein kinase
MFNPYTAAQVNFAKLKEIGGEGKNSKAFIAHDYQLDAEVVIKEILKAKLVHQATFFEESRTLYLSSHPNIVQLHYACEDAGCVYLAMPFYKSGSVKSLMAKRHLSVREIVRYGCQVLSALHNIHSKRLVHFDIKPDNILLSDRNEALLSDFGQAKFVDEDGFATPDGLYNRMVPPEVLETKDFTAAVDIYQFGLTLYRMCNGDQDFYEQLGKLTAATFPDALRKGDFPDRKAFLPHIPSKLRSIIKKCLQVKPADRYATALDVANDLALIDGEILDWQFDNASGDNVWTKDAGELSYRLLVTADGKSEMTKSKSGGKAQRVVAACKASMTMKEVEKILGSY